MGKNSFAFAQKSRVASEINWNEVLQNEGPCLKMMEMNSFENFDERQKYFNKT